MDAWDFRGELKGLSVTNRCLVRCNVCSTLCFDLVFVTDTDGAISFMSQS
ncbi:unnamed protein product, partial [Tenebrio molitor]